MGYRLTIKLPQRTLYAETDTAAQLLDIMEGYDHDPKVAFRIADADSGRPVDIAEVNAAACGDTLRQLAGAC